jgi:uncharacterized protein involved in outer membrane biogenesis
MKFLLKWILRLALLAVVLAVVLVLSKDWLFKKYAERRIAAATGLETRIGKLEESFFKPVVHLENVRLYNPASFGGAPLVDIRELHLEINRGALAQGKLRLTLVRLDVTELNLVRDRAGRTNVALLGQTLGGNSATSKSDFKFEQIDVLNLSIGKLRYTDLANPANNRTVDFGVQREVFTNIRSQNDLYGMAMLLLIRCGPGLQEQILGAVRGAANTSGEKMKQATEEVRGLLKK